MDWKPITAMPGVYLGNADGKVFVASSTSPRFCFEADSESEAIGISTRALAFYQTAKAAIIASKEPK
jgi:hypothetical protein